MSVMTRRLAILPAGAQRAALIQMSKADAEQLVRDHGTEIIEEWCRPEATHASVAQSFLPGLFAHSPNTAICVVEKAIAQLLSKEEREQIASAHWTWNLAAQRASDPEIWQEYRRRGGFQRHQLHPFDPAALIKGGKYKPRTKEERGRTIELLKDPAYHHRAGRYEGMPDLRKVAAAINQEFFEGKPERNRQSMSNFYCEWKRSLKESSQEGE